MKGEMLVIRIDGTITRTTIETAPTLEALQQAVDGQIELVPFFDTFELDGRATPCVAFCDEEHKLHGKLLNAVATRHWFLSVRQAGLPSPDDVLGGDVVVIVGDEELLSSL